ncbi:MAG: DUF58 domain-containing protein [Pseudomonadales bacterium]
MAQSTPSQRLLDPEVLARLSNLPLVARTVVEGFLVGLHRSPFFGFSQEFAEYRPYEVGDDPRFIDWNVFARTDRTYLKRFLGETNTHLMILLDASGSMDFRSAELSKLDYAKLLVASLAYLATRQHDAVGLMVFDDAMREYRAPSSRRGQLAGLLHMLDSVEARAGTDMDVPFQRFRELVGRRGMVAVVSDFYCDPGALLRSVKPLAARGQDVVLFQVMDPDELSLELRESTLLEDLESGAAMEVDPQYARGEYRDRIEAHVNELKRTASQFGIDHLVMRTSDPLDPALRRYLLFRQRHF